MMEGRSMYVIAVITNNMARAPQDPALPSDLASAAQILHAGREQRYLIVYLCSVLDRLTRLYILLPSIAAYRYNLSYSPT